MACNTLPWRSAARGVAALAQFVERQTGHGFLDGEGHECWTAPRSRISDCWWPVRHAIAAYSADWLIGAGSLPDSMLSPSAPVPAAAWSGASRSD